MDSPPNSDPGLHGLAAAAAAVQRPQLLARSLSESRKNDEHEQQTKQQRSNNVLSYQVLLQLVLQDHNYGAPPPPTPPLSPIPPVVQNSRNISNHNMQPVAPPLTAQDLCGMAALATVADQVRAGSTSLSLLLQAEEDSRGSPLSSDEHDDPGPEGEETETAAEGEGDDDSVTRCICDLEHDDGYMICCDKCFVWQHVDCMGIDRTNIPDEYMCEMCQPRRVDRNRARNLQMRKQMHNDTSSSDDDQPTMRHVTPVVVGQTRRLSAAAKKRQAKRENKKVVKRQRRDSAAVAAREQRVSERRANKKRELLTSVANNSPSKTDSKRIGMRRRSKGKLDSLDEETQDGWGGSNHSGGGHTSPGAATAVTVAAAPQQPQQLRQWIDNYEEAVTNHYSPELRARISNIKVNGVHSDFKVASSAVQKCRTTMQENGLKVLISTSQLHANQPIIEIRGKYMLAAQHQQSRGVGRGAAAAAASPYILFYTLPKEGTEVCVDARTYGNDARFVRSSCKPNAEVRHCIEKGALHLYLVASTTLERHSEITIKHEDTGPRSHCKDCPPPNAVPTPVLRNGFIAQDPPPDRRGDRRRRGSRRNTTSEDSMGASTGNSNSGEPVVASPPSAAVPTTTAAAATPGTASPTMTTPPAQVTAPLTPLTPPAQSPSSTPITRRGPKSPLKVTTPTTPVTPAPPTPASEDSNDGMPDDRETPSSSDKRKMTREERKMEAIVKAFERMEKAEQRRQETLARQQKQRGPDTIEREEEEQQDAEAVNRKVKGYYRRRPRGRSSSGASSQAMSADESCITRKLSPGPNNMTSPRSLASPPPMTPQSEKTSAMLANCLSFKFPKTKKVLMNEWLNKPVETPVSPVKLESGEEVRTGAAAAKKRWLRQAISEESEPVTQCNSPRAGSPPGGDYVTPLKKRRLARESVSSEHSFTPPTTPASDKDEARSPEQEEIPGQDMLHVKEEPTLPPASQIHNAARCVEEAVKVLTSDSTFMQIIGEKMMDIKMKDDDMSLSPIKIISPVKVVEPLDDKPFKMEDSPVKEEKHVVSPMQIFSSCTPPPQPPLTPPLLMPHPSPAPVSLSLPPPPSSPIALPVAPLARPCIPPPTPETKEPYLAASIKRKLSISEYRQRKQKAEGDKGGDGDGPNTPSPTSQDDDRERSAAASPFDSALDSADGKTDVGGAYMRWNSEPTLVERQRENLMERLKREFGLSLEEQDPNKLAKIINNVTAGTNAKKTISPVTGGAIKTPPNNLLPPLPPLEPPSVKCPDPHNIPLPPCSPPPLHDLLLSSEPDSCSTTVQNGPSGISIQSKNIIGGVQIKNQILSSSSSTTITHNSISKCKTISKKPIPTSTPASLQNNSIRPTANSAFSS